MSSRLTHSFSSRLFLPAPGSRMNGQRAFLVHSPLYLHWRSRQEERVEVDKCFACTHFTGVSQNPLRPHSHCRLQKLGGGEVGAQLFLATTICSHSRQLFPAVLEEFSVIVSISSLLSATCCHMHREGSYRNTQKHKLVINWSLYHQNLQNKFFQGWNVPIFSSGAGALAN